MTKSDRSSKHVIVVGAGIVGISTAIWLQRAGHRVTIVDREGPAAGTSYGNAGVLAAGAIVQVPVPGILKKAPGMLLDRNFPLFLRWSYLPKLLPFLRRFLATANHESVAASAKSLDLLLHDSFEQHQALARGTGAEKFIHPDDYVFGYKDKAAFQADAFGWNIRRKNGVEFEEMDAARLAEFDPLMAGRFGYGVRCPNHGRISDPGAYVKALAAHAEAQGATMVIDELQDVVIESGKVTGVKTAHQNLHADEVVLSAGIWSVQILKKLGLSVPMESERGYHIEFVNSSVMPKSPTMVASGKFVMTPMEGRLRCAGVVEFGGLNDKRSTGPLALLKRQMAELFPDLEYDRIDEWMGHRPSTIDSLPLIGQLDSHKNLWSAFGHQHIGLTGGPKTGWWIAKMIGGEAINVDLGRFDPNRF